MSAGWKPSWFYHAVRRLALAALHRLWEVRVSGLEHLPPAGRLIVAANHCSWMDPVLVGLTVSRVRSPRFLAKEELFRNLLAAWLFRHCGVISLTRGRGDVSAMRSALEVLEAEGCMVLFPEGTRSRTGVPLRPKPGLGFLARRARVPVVPARVWNTERFPARMPLRIKFGPPLRFEGGDDSKSYQAFADRVMETVFRL